MKFSTVKYHIMQAFESLLHNRLMTLAAIATVSACCFILIITMGIVLNIDYMLAQIENTVGITVYLGDEVTESEIQALKNDIENIPHVKILQYLSKEDAFEKARAEWGAEANQLDSLKDDNPLPRSFEITVDALKNQDNVISALEELQFSFEKKMIAERGAQASSEDALLRADMDIQKAAENVAAELYGEYMTVIQADDASVFTEESEKIEETDSNAEILMEGEQESESADKPSEEDVYSDEVKAAGYEYKGIEKIRHAKDVANTLLAVSANIHIIAVILLAMMIVISIAIIVNTIKLTVFVRRNEINIMKYVGATDWFIRWPFVLEGIIIGFIGALLPTAFCFLGYLKLYENYMNYFTMISRIVELKPTGEIFSVITSVTLIFGSVLGAFGSVTSIRKHLNV